MSQESSKTLQQVANDIPSAYTLQYLFENCPLDEIEKILDKFNSIGCTSFRIAADEIKEILEKQENA